MGTTFAYKKGFGIKQTPGSSEEALGRTPALLAEAHGVPGQDADSTRKHLELSSLAAIVQSESSSSAPDCNSRCPGRLPELLITSLVLGLAFNWSLYKYDKRKQLLFPQK